MQWLSLQKGEWGGHVVEVLLCSLCLAIFSSITFYVLVYLKHSLADCEVTMRLNFLRPKCTCASVCGFYKTETSSAFYMYDIISVVIKANETLQVQCF